MDGVHDLGGLEGFGPIDPTPAEPTFHSDWERTAFAMLTPLLLNGINLDDLRWGIEKMHPVEYLSSRYYEHWLHTFENAVIARGLISRAELDERAAHYRDNPQAPLPDRKDPDQAAFMLEVLHAGASPKREVTDTPRFRVGDAVRIRAPHPHHHTRSARYVRGKRGEVTRVYDAFVLPDTNARYAGENPQYVYNVRFSAVEVWGDLTAEPAQTVHFDCWESYLEPA